jgi:hypothetical protein
MGDESGYLAAQPVVVVLGVVPLLFGCRQGGL